MLNKNEVDKILEPAIEGLGYEYICCEVSNSGSAKFGGILRIFIDSENGITLDDCTKVNQHINRLLDVELSDITSKYSMEISSPGLDRPLVKLDHFKKYIGKKVKIKLNMAVDFKNTGDMQKNVVGCIDSIENNNIIIKDLDDKNLIYSIELDNINKANLVPQWER